MIFTRRPHSQPRPSIALSASISRKVVLGIVLACLVGASWELSAQAADPAPPVTAANPSGEPASNPEPTPIPEPAPSPKKWRLGLSEQGGMLVRNVSGLYFSQYYNSIDIEYDFLIVRPLWLGVSTGYAATLPSQISEYTPLISPGWDAFHTDIHANLQTDNGWLVRLGLDAWYSKIGNVQLYSFFLGAELGIAKQFDLGGVLLEPGIVSTWQFRRDPGLAWILGARVRILF